MSIEVSKLDCVRQHASGCEGEERRPTRMTMGQRRLLSVVLVTLLCFQPSHQKKKGRHASWKEGRSVRRTSAQIARDKIREAGGSLSVSSLIRAERRCWCCDGWMHQWRVLIKRDEGTPCFDTGVLRGLSSETMTIPNISRMHPKMKLSAGQCLA